MGRSKPSDLASLVLESRAWTPEDWKPDFWRESIEGIEEEVPFIVVLMTGEVERSDSFKGSGGEAFSVVSVAIQILES